MKTMILEKLELATNVVTLSQRGGGTELYAILHADGYGTGLGALALELRGAGITRFAVTEPEEAIALREAGLLQEEILLLRTLRDEAMLEQLAELSVVFTVDSYDSGSLLNAMAERKGTVLEAHIRVDAGLGLGGFSVIESDKITSLYRNLPSLAFSGIYAQARKSGWRDGSTEISQLQLEQLLTRIRNAGYETGTVHLGEDAPRSEEATALRVGRSLLGRNPRLRGKKLCRLGRGELVLDEPYWLPEGSVVGEFSPIRLRKAAQVVTIPVGLENGLGAPVQAHRGLFARLFRGRSGLDFWIGGQRVRALGGIGARETILDVTRLRCAAGDLVTFDLDPLYARGFTVEFR